MRNLRSIGCAALAAAALLAGCGKSSSPKEQLQLSSFAAKAADTVCSALAKCGCTDASAVASCKQAFVSDMTDQMAFEVLMYPGATLDPAAAQTCLDDLKAELSDCSLPPTTNLVGRPVAPRFDLLGCEGVFKGVQISGERCQVDAECAAGLACDQGTLSCATPAAVDGDCTSISCADNAWCNAGTCAAKVEAGADCSAGGDRACVDGLDCWPSSSAGHNVCAAPVAVDGDCSEVPVCVSGAYCNASHLCATLIADGVGCDEGYQCEHGWCNTQGVCEDPGICELLNTRT
jgi:hypothetical protein